MLRLLVVILYERGRTQCIKTWEYLIAAIDDGQGRAAKEEKKQEEAAGQVWEGKETPFQRTNRNVVDHLGKVTDCLGG